MKWSKEQVEMFAAENKGRAALGHGVDSGVSYTGRIIGIEHKRDRWCVSIDDWLVDPSTVLFLDGEPERAPMVGDVNNWCGAAVGMGWQGCTRPKGHPPTVHVAHDSDGNELDRESVTVTEAQKSSESLRNMFMKRIGKHGGTRPGSIVYSETPNPTGRPVVKTDDTDFITAVDTVWRLACGEPNITQETREALRKLTPMLAKKPGRSAK